MNVRKMKTQPDPDAKLEQILDAVKVLETFAQEHESNESHDCQRYCLKILPHECQRYCESDRVRIAALVMDNLGLKSKDWAAVDRILKEREQYRLNMYSQRLMDEYASRVEREEDEILNANEIQ